MTTHRSIQFHWPVTLALILLVFWLALPALVGFGWSDRANQEKLENRRMAQFPEWSQFQERPAEFIRQVDTFLNDGVGFKRQANELFRKLRYYVLKDPPFANITIGQDGFTFMNSHRIDRPNFVFQLLCEQQLHPTADLVRDMDNTFASVSHYYSSRGYKVTITAAPTNVAVYPDKLPPRVDQGFRVDCQAYPDSDNLLFQLKRKGLEDNRYDLFYPLEIFRSHRDEAYFYPKERFHWCGRSVFLFVRHLLVSSGVTDSLKLDDSAEIGTAPDDLTMFFGFSRDIPVLNYPYRDMPTTMKTATWSKDLLERGNILHFETPAGLSRKRGLLISNSFGIELAPHLAKGFEHLFFFNLNSLKPEEEKNALARVVELARPEYIYILFDDAGIIAAPKRLRAFLDLDREQPDTEPMIR